MVLHFSTLCTTPGALCEQCLHVHLVKHVNDRQELHKISKIVKIEINYFDNFVRNPLAKFDWPKNLEASVSEAHKI